jgi:hypothetical protein
MGFEHVNGHQDGRNVWCLGIRSMKIKGKESESQIWIVNDVQISVISNFFIVMH